METTQITELVLKLQSLSKFDQTEAIRFLPNSDVDRPYRELLTGISNEDYLKISHDIRFNFSFVVLVEYVKGDGSRHAIKRDLSGSYIVLCYAEGIHYETIVMDTYNDCVTLINHLKKPHHSILKAIKKL